MRLVTKNSPRGSVLRDLHQAGSAKVVFPRSAGDELQAVTVNTAGGITGGDRFEMSFEAGADSALSITTQAAERAYAAQGADAGRLDVTMAVACGARLNWVPQETILFDGCHFARKTRVDLAPDAHLLFAEPLVFGRAAMGEILSDITFRDRVEIWRDGKPLFIDAMAISGDAQAHMGGMIAEGAGALASVVYVARDAQAQLVTVRALLPDTAGASLLGEDVLHIRMLAHDSFVLRQTLVPVLTCLSQKTLPRVWMI